MDDGDESIRKPLEPVVHSEAVSKENFSVAGWNFFTKKVIEYQNLLYLEARKQAMARAGDEIFVQYSRSDVRIAMLKLAMRQAGERLARRRWCQAAAMIASMMTGICGNWAFANVRVSGDVLPWTILVVCACTAVSMGILSMEFE